MNLEGKKINYYASWIYSYTHSSSGIESEKKSWLGTNQGLGNKLI